MSIIIKRMEMPNSCGNCPLRRSNENRVWCSVIGGYIDFSKEYDCRRDDCPIVEISTPHGRLIDIDDAIESYGERAELGYVSQSKFLNVVIQAEGSKDE